MNSRLFYSVAFFPAGILLALLPAAGSACFAADMGISPLTGQPQGFGPGQSAPVGDFGGRTSQQPVIIDDGPRIHDYRNAPTIDPSQPITSQSEFKAQWDAWHKRVAALIYTRFNSSAQKLFKKSPPLLCQVGYMIASDGRVGQVRVLQPSTNPVYDAMLLTTIKSIAHDPILVFPHGSKRQFIEKSATFTWNKSGGSYGRNSVGNFDDEPLPYWGPNHGSQVLVPNDKQGGL